MVNGKTTILRTTIGRRLELQIYGDGARFQSYKGQSDISGFRFKNSMAGKTSKQNGKKGGRPKGAVSDEKKAQQEAFKELKMSVLRMQKSLLNAQAGVAKGLTFLYVITTNSKGVRSKPELVTSQATIEEYLADELEDSENEYYFMSTKEPDTKAIDSLLDRVHGRARQNIGLDGGDDDKPIAIQTVENELKSWANKKGD